MTSLAPEHVAQGEQGATPEAPYVEPAMQAATQLPPERLYPVAHAPQTASAVTLQAIVCTLLAAAQLVHTEQGGVPAVDQVEPATHAVGAAPVVHVDDGTDAQAHVPLEQVTVWPAGQLP